MARHLGVGRHPRPVGSDGAVDGVPDAVLVEASRPTGDHEAGREALDVPLEGSVERLVEVVDVEDEVALGRCEQPEVGEVGVAAQLDDDPGIRGGREVGRHRQRRPAVERERRDRHPAVADRDQLGDPGGGLLLQERDRVGRSGGGRQPACAPTGTRARAASPAARRSSRDGSGDTSPLSPRPVPDPRRVAPPWMPRPRTPGRPPPGPSPWRRSGPSRSAPSGRRRRAAREPWGSGRRRRR